MKRLIAILLLSLFLFQTGGHLLLHTYLEYKTESFFNEQSAKGKYNIHDLVEIKLPINMPGITGWSEYENISGQIQFQDECYNYVRMKLTPHFMYLMCVPNYDHTQLIGENIIHAKGVKDIPVPKKDHVPADRIATTQIFQYSFTRFAFNTPVIDVKPLTFVSVPKTAWQSPDIPEQPPQNHC
ncbi:MAG TPA: hypothetical protein VHA56_20825 [Mucilaginibacter sp.]|nr:hypothetical protein [Mucilaginibacter sp.]